MTPTVRRSVPLTGWGGYTETPSNARGPLGEFLVSVAGPATNLILGVAFFAFRSAAGTLELSQSQSYTAAIRGFSTSGGTALDLGDIGFVSATEATFSGTATSGVLTVADGTHTAHITLIGDYTGHHFVASSDSRGGTNIIDSGSGAPSPHRLVAAMAGMAGAGAGVAGVAREAWREPWRPLLATSGHARFA